ncbi:MAG TPA: ribosome maturation factor RimM [Alphaproteobacteria bacterium]
MSRIQIGKITGAHGIKGEVKVLSQSQDAGLLFRKDGVFTASEGGLIVKLIARTENKPSMFISKIEGVTDRNEAEKFTNTPLYIDRDDLPQTDDGEFYLNDLVGLTVVTPEGKNLGTIMSIQNFGASDLIDVQSPEGKNNFMPLAEPFLVEIDMEAGHVVMQEIEVMP